MRDMMLIILSVHWVLDTIFGAVLYLEEPSCRDLGGTRVRHACIKRDVVLR